MANILLMDDDRLICDAIGEAEQQYLKDLFSMTEGNTDEACRISGLSQSPLYALFKKYRLSPRA